MIKNFEVKMDLYEFILLTLYLLKKIENRDINLLLKSFGVKMDLNCLLLLLLLYMLFNIMIINGPFFLYIMKSIFYFHFNLIF
jgi:hypothetical protein